MTRTRDFPDQAYCPYFQQTMELIGKRWTASILRALFAGATRFSEIARTVPGLSNRLLTQRLHELIEAGIVVPVPGIPHGTYQLTEKGEDLRGIFAQLEAWNARWEDREASSS